MNMKAVSLFSGGKDSTYAIWTAEQMGWDIAMLVSVIPESSSSWMFHYPNVKWTVLQSESMGLPHRRVTVKAGKDEELNSLIHSLRSLKRQIDFDAILSGVIASRFQKNRLDSVAKTLGITHLTPIWNRTPSSLLADIIRDGFKAIFVAVSAMGLDRRWLGRSLDEESMQDLAALAERYRIHISGEGGEYETFVCDGPLFNKAVRILETEELWDGSSGILVIRKAELEEKQPNG